MNENLPPSLIQYSKKLQNDDDFEIIYELSPLYDVDELNSMRPEIRESMLSIESRQDIIESRINELNHDIDRLTNHADGLDYAVAVGCGVLCGMIDSIFVGDFDFADAHDKAKEKINEYVKNKAENVRVTETVKNAVEKAKRKAAEKGEILSDEGIEKLERRIKAGVENKMKKVLEQDAADGTVNALRRSIAKLEQFYKLASDNAHVGLNGMNAASHHLADMAHHPTPMGLYAAIIGEFFRAGILVDKDGNWTIVRLGLKKEDRKRWLELILPIVVAGIITWLLNSVESKYKEEIDTKLPKPLANIIHALSKAPLAIAALKSVGNVFNNWWGHLASDMAGSKSTPGAGMGIPGLFVSLLKEISSIPPLNFTGLPKVVDKIYTDNKFDMRAEMAVLNELGKQSIPVIFGDILVRSFYFVRHLVEELSDKKDYKEVNWEYVIPLNNRTIVRMMTIETGAFTACDLADAAIRSAIKNGTPQNPRFWNNLVLRVNFVGIGRFAIAVTSDVKMGINRSAAIKERMFLQNQMLMLENAKMLYYQENMWLSAMDAEMAMQSLLETVFQSLVFYDAKIGQLDQKWSEVSSSLSEVLNEDSDFRETLMDILD